MARKKQLGAVEGSIEQIVDENREYYYLCGINPETLKLDKVISYDTFDIMNTRQESLMANLNQENASQEYRKKTIELFVEFLKFTTEGMRFFKLSAKTPKSDEVLQNFILTRTLESLLPFEVKPKDKKDESAVGPVRAVIERVSGDSNVECYVP